MYKNTRRFNRKSISVITPPATLAVSVSDMKDYLRVDTSDDDAMIESFIRASQDAVKQYLKRSLISETLELTMDGFVSNGDPDGIERLGEGTHIGCYAYLTGYGNEFNLPFLPIQSIESIKYFTRDNAENTFSDTKYTLDGTGGRVFLNESQSFPSNLRSRASVKVRYIAGYGDASDIPDAIVQGIKDHVAQMYDCREACGLSDVCKSRMSAYKIMDNLGYV